ncbi:MAG TPA: methylmalonyl-CoA epimerase [Chloroflexota bacterium]|nr:methylmalonyl-CoA epimerase [Chloroflexota bacterium]
MKIKRVEHVGVAVNSYEEAAGFYGLLGLKIHGTEEVAGSALKVAMLPVGESEIELLEPAGPESAVAKFLEKKGEGIHHIAFCVEDIHGAVKELVDGGVRMIDKAPRPGAGGKLVAFVHPAAAHGVLIELVEDKKRPAPPLPRPLLPPASMERE